MKKIEENPLKRYGMHAGASHIIFERARTLRSKMTVAEEILWEFLKCRPLGFKFRRQHPFDRYVLDFYCHSAKLCLEVDGKHHSYDPVQISTDNAKANVLHDYGIHLIRFTNNEVYNDLSEVKSKLIDLLTEIKGEHRP